MLPTYHIATHPSISENYLRTYCWKRKLGVLTLFFLDIGEYKFVRIRILMKYFRDARWETNSSLPVPKRRSVRRCSQAFQ